MSFLNITLILYTWGTVCILLIFLYSIARFYEEKSGRRSFSLFFFVPLILFAAAAVRYAYLNPIIIGDLWGDILRFLGGVVLSGFGFFLLSLMMGGRT